MARERRKGKAALSRVRQEDTHHPKFGCWRQGKQSEREMTERREQLWGEREVIGERESIGCERGRAHLDPSSVSNASWVESARMGEGDRAGARTWWTGRVNQCQKVRWIMRHCMVCVPMLSHLPLLRGRPRVHGLGLGGRRSELLTGPKDEVVVLAPGQRDHGGLCGAARPEVVYVRHPVP